MAASATPNAAGTAMKLQTTAKGDSITLGQPLNANWTLSCNGSTCTSTSDWNPVLNLKQTVDGTFNYSLTATYNPGGVIGSSAASVTGGAPTANWSANSGGSSVSTTSNITLTNGGF